MSESSNIEHDTLAHYMIMIILDKDEYCYQVIKCWEELKSSTGKKIVKGITAFDSTGRGRTKNLLDAGKLVHMANYRSLLERLGESNHTLMTVVEGQQAADQVIDGVMKVLGDLSESNKGVLFAWPLYRAVGIRTD